MTIPVDNSDPLDPSYYDPTNPASPYYDPTLDPSLTILTPAAPAAPAALPVTDSTTKTDKPADSAITAEEADRTRRKGVRHMRNALDQQEIIQFDQTKPNPIGK